MQRILVSQALRTEKTRVGLKAHYPPEGRRQVSDSTLDAQMEPTQAHDLEQSLCCSPPAQLKLLVSREKGPIRKDTEGNSYSEIIPLACTHSLSIGVTCLGLSQSAAIMPNEQS